MPRPVCVFAWGAAWAVLAVSCSNRDERAPSESAEGACELGLGADAEPPEFLQRIGCGGDFTTLASSPLDVTLPGARSLKVVLDQDDQLALYFQNSQRYRLHYEFVSTHLSGGSLPTVGSLSDFNASEYYTPGRRFVLGSVTHYDGPQAWVLELAPYDTASSRLIALLFERVKASAFFGSELAFHPTSEALAEAATHLSAAVPVKTTEELYEKTAFQPLALGTSVGRLRFESVATLDPETLSADDVVVLDSAPSDLPVVAGLISAEFQTPLSHLNVLAQNRHTPNLGLRAASTNGELRALEGKLVELSVNANSWSVREVSEQDAVLLRDAHRPSPITLPALNLELNALTEIEKVTTEGDGSLRAALEDATGAFGATAAHASILSRTAGLSGAKAFAIPISHYVTFMHQNGFSEAIRELLAVEPSLRTKKLAALRQAILAAPLDPDFVDALLAKLRVDYAGARVLFRSSTNGEALASLSCAGCYEAFAADPADLGSVLDAVREAYASAWTFRSFEERSYYGIDHESLGVGLLVQENSAEQTASGVALTANPFDAAGVDPALYINAQPGDVTQVVSPPIGVTCDQFLYFFDAPNQPISYLARSNQGARGAPVLSNARAFQLGLALSAVQDRFSPAYGPASGKRGFYGMDVEFAFELDGALSVTDARPHPQPDSNAFGG